MKNYLWNMFTSLVNGQLAKKSFVFVHRTKICESFLKVLWNEGFILGYNINYFNNKIKVFLKYKNEKPVINSIKPVSKPSFRVYYSVKQIWLINSTKTFIIFSTNKGLMSITDCKKQQVGGEPYIVIN